MPRKGPAQRRELLPDPLYRSLLVSQLVNKVMLHGKRTVAELVAGLQQRYPGDDERVAEGVYKFLEVSRAKGWIRRQA